MLLSRHYEGYQQMQHMYHYTRNRYDSQPACSWSDVGISIPHGATGELRTLCPQCSPDRPRPSKSLSVNLSQGIWFCHYCGWKGSLRRSGTIPSLPRPGPRHRSPDDIQRRCEALVRVWREARRITPDDPVARYLQRRGLWQEPLPSSLRCHPHLPYWYDDTLRTYHPALIAAVQDPHGTVATLHRIYLTAAGEKANVPSPKKSMRTPTTVRGAAVRLDTPTDTIVVTEGIETGLAVRISTGIPVWSGLSAIGMAHMVVPDAVRLIVIAADHDVTATGEGAAKKLAHRLLAEGRRVKIIMPRVAGADWADAMEGAHHG
jgi:hypothetical protein